GLCFTFHNDVFDYASWKTRTLKGLKRALSNMVLLIIFSRLIRPSTGLVVHGMTREASMVSFFSRPITIVP
ncbi:MAG: hypothetical protein ABF513_06150, partial [Acetobacter malorum]